MKLDKKEIQDIFEALGYKKHTINKEVVFEKKDVYYRLTFVNDEFGYVIESAENIDEAKKGRFEDDDVIKTNKTKEEIALAIKECLSKYY